MLSPEDQALYDGVRHARGEAQRRAIAKTITLLESTRADHRARAEVLLNALLPASGKSFRLGISGVPGVGKSTFIEALGLHLIREGHRVAVLAVDPSSSVSGGSILGDKTRMERLSVEPDAFIRPSPTSGTLGGVTAHTREAMIVLEGRLAAVEASWPEAQVERMAIENHRMQYQAALESRKLAARKARDCRALRDAVKEAFRTTYAEVMSRVEAEFPRDKVTQELFFDEVRTRSALATADTSEGDEAAY